MYLQHKIILLLANKNTKKCQLMQVIIHYNERLNMIYHFLVFLLIIQINLIIINAICFKKIKS